MHPSSCQEVTCLLVVAGTFVFDDRARSYLLLKAEDELLLQARNRQQFIAAGTAVS